MSQFLIGKLELYQENFPQRAEKEKFKSQFLIGKGEPADFYIEVERISAGKVSQLLIGKV